MSKSYWPVTILYYSQAKSYGFNMVINIAPISYACIEIREVKLLIADSYKSGFADSS